MGLNLSKRSTSSFISLALYFPCKKQKHDYDHENREGILSVDEIGLKSLIPS